MLVENLGEASMAVIEQVGRLVFRNIRVHGFEFQGVKVSPAWPVDHNTKLSRVVVAAFYDHSPARNLSLNHRYC